MVYWAVTGLFCLAFVLGGMSHLLRADFIAEAMGYLGYPAYVMSILGVAKLLGVVALLGRHRVACLCGRPRVRVARAGDPAGRGRGFLPASTGLAPDRRGPEGPLREARS